MIEIKRLLAEGAAELAAGGLEDGAGEAALLLCHCLAVSRTELFLRAAERVDDATCRHFRELVARRREREPYAYIVGEKEFWSLPFHVDAGVLIPRPETEYLLEVVLAKVRTSGLVVDRCLDLCCGSGVIAAVLALELGATVLALDSSLEAVAVTRRNSRRHGLEDRIMPLGADLFTALADRQRFPLIVSNPPYVSRQAIRDELQPEVSRYEPAAALDGGADGLAVIRRIADEVLGRLLPGGLFGMEFGADQGDAVRQLFAGARWGRRRFGEVEILQDYSGHDRVLIAWAEEGETS